MTSEAQRYCLVVLAWAATLSAAWAELPDSLDEPTFRSFLTEHSEPDGGFADENFVSNELGLQRLLSNMEREFAPGSVYIGVGPEQNFSYIAALEPRLAFIVDIRRQNAMEHLLYKALFELSPTRAEFIGRLFSRKSLVPAAPDSTSTEIGAFWVRRHGTNAFGTCRCGI